ERQPRSCRVIRVIAQDLLRQARQQPAELLPGPLMPAEQCLQPVRPLGLRLPADRASEQRALLEASFA
ncbi:MAG TPA: hypothetical protein VFQ68_09630, partial [Streptosporangiaceae bacterium]|nr:hypothetical protein [Streptosporangiaceae bacterium]